jgi:hypothetical protein
MSQSNNDNSALMRQTTEHKSRRLFNVAAVFLLLSFLLFLCQLINFGMFEATASESDSLPVSIRAAARADYSRDMNALPIPPISEDILRQIIMDIPAKGNPQDRMATLQAVLSSPIPTMTLDHLLPTALTPTRTISPPPSRTTTQIPTLQKTRTPTSVFTSTKFYTPPKTSAPTRTSIPTKTATSTRTPTPTPTFTLLPTATLAATNTPTPTPTSTVVTQTDTPTPTSTPTDGIPTDTHTPTPTPTNTPSCMFASSGISLSGKNIEMTITNNGDALVTIDSMNVNWPDMPNSQAVSEIKFNGVTIVNANDPLPPSDYPSENNWTGTQSDLELATSESKSLMVLFQDNLEASGYNITVTFDNGCTVGESN